MSDLDPDQRTDRRNARGGRRALLAGLVLGALIVLVAIALANRSSNQPHALSTSDQQAASAWAQQNERMWSWMRSHWDEMTLMHQHWGDVSWMQAHLTDYAWMRDHWDDMAWMHDHWSAMSWMHAQGMMGTSPGGMMGQSGS